MTDIRYGVGSLEEEIRLRREQVMAGATFASEPDNLEEAKGNSIQLKPDRNNMSGTTAEVTMKIKGGKMSFDLVYSDGRGANGLNIKKLAGMVR